MRFAFSPMPCKRWSASLLPAGSRFFNWLRVGNEKETVDRNNFTAQATSPEHPTVRVCEPSKPRLRKCWTRTYPKAVTA